MPLHSVALHLGVLCSTLGECVCNSGTLTAPQRAALGSRALQVGLRMLDRWQSLRRLCRGKFTSSRWLLGILRLLGSAGHWTADLTQLLLPRFHDKGALSCGSLSEYEFRITLLWLHNLTNGDARSAVVNGLCPVFGCCCSTEVHSMAPLGFVIICTPVFLRPLLGITVSPPPCILCASFLQLSPSLLCCGFMAVDGLSQLPAPSGCAGFPPMQCSCHAISKPGRFGRSI